MRRLLLIFLLAFLPLQASWAAVCGYCPDECVVEADAKVAAVQDQSDTPSFETDDDCRCCQLGGVGIATSLSVSSFVTPPANSDASPGSTFLSSVRPARPERPKWTRAA